MAGWARYAVMGCSLMLAAGMALQPCATGQAQGKQNAKSSGASGTPVVVATGHEDWTSLSLSGTGLKLIRPVPAEKDDIPNTGFIRERFEVEWREGDPFDLYVIRPRGVERPPVILYLYSYPEDTEQFKNNAWCESAVGGGFAAVGFVGAVVGHRTRYHGPQDWFVSEMPEALGATVHDVQLILEYLETRKDLDASRIGMFGTGSGGAIAVMASAADSRIKVLDLLAPWGDWPAWVAGTAILRDNERAKFGDPAFLAKVAPLEPAEWLPKVKANAVRLQDVRGNKAMPDKAQERLEAAAPDFAVINEYGNGRAFLAATQPTPMLFEWMKGKLKSGETTRVVAEKSQRVHVIPAAEPATQQNWPNVGPSSAPTQKDAKDSQKDAKEKDKPSRNRE